MKRFRLLSLLLGPLTIAIVAAVAPPVFAGISPDELCTGDPCVIAGDHELPVSLDRLVIDFGNRAVILTGTLDIGQDQVLLAARSFDIGGQSRAPAPTRIPAASNSTPTTSRFERAAWCPCALLKTASAVSSKCSRSTRSPGR
jgi:hypothetical protein